MEINNEDPNETALDVIGAGGQVSPLLRVKDSAGTIKFAVDKDGNITGTIGAVAQMHYTSNYDTIQEAIDSITPILDPVHHPWERYFVEEGGMLFHPAGVYEMSGETYPLVLPSHCYIVGAGRNSSIFDYSAETDTTDFLVFRPLKTEWGSGAQMFDGGLRDLKFVGNRTVNRDCIDSYFEPGVTTYAGYHKGEISNCHFEDIGGNAIHLDASHGLAYEYGCITCVKIDHNRFQGVSSNMAFQKRCIGSTGDVRAIWVTSNHACANTWWGDTYYNYGFVYAVFPISWYFGHNVVEGCQASGFEIAGAAHCTWDNTYFEGTNYPISLAGSSHNCQVYNTFQYQGVYSFNLVDTQFSTIDGWSATYPAGEGCIGYFKGNLTGVKVRNIFTGSDDFDLGVYCWDGVTAEPDYVEECYCDNHHSRKIVRGIMMNERVKTDAGEPSEATYGDSPGNMVFNTNENKLYIHTTSGWKYINTDG